MYKNKIRNRKLTTQAIAFEELRQASTNSGPSVSGARSVVIETHITWGIAREAQSDLRD